MKNKIKIGFLLFTLFLITGCNPEYNLEIKDGTFKEDITLFTDYIKYQDPNDVQEIDLEKNIYYAYEDEKEENMYKKEIIKDGKKYKIILSYTHDPSKFKDALSLKYFKYYAFIDTEDYYYIKLEDGLKSGLENQFLRKATIKITTDRKVIQHNADRVEKNTYIWNITKTNAKNKELRFQISKKEKHQEKKENGNVIIMAGIAIFIIATLIFIFYIIVQKLLDYRFRS